jgi:hypothetical protein
MKKRYTVIGGNYYRSYTGTGTFTGLDIVGKCDTIEELKEILKEKYEECGGLIAVVDTETGELI